MFRLIDLLIEFPASCLGTLLLIFVIFIRPQEFVGPLTQIPLIYIVFAFATIGTIIEVGLGKIRTLWSPQMPILLMWTAWAFVPTMWRIGVTEGFRETLTSVGFQVLFFFIVFYGSQSFMRMKVVTTFILGVSIFLAGVAIHQGHQDFQCVNLARDESGVVDYSTGIGDGRLCDTARECEKDAPDPADVFDCEKVGLFNSFSTGRGRVRWRGKLSDPNELSLLVAASLTFAFAMHGASRAKARHFGLLMVIATIVYCVILSKSRGGILIMLAVFGVQFIRRYGFKGLLLGLVVAAPLVLFGGRSGAEADESADERIQLLYAGIDMVKEFPFLGVGVEQYKEHAWPPLTAHNSYLLPAAELGLLGQFLWYSLLYVSLKIPLKVVFSPPYGMDSRLYPYAIALSTSFAGMLVGIFFLSMCYHPLVYIFLGLSGGLYGAVRQTAPSFRVSVTFREYLYIAASCVVFLVVMYTYTRLKHG